MFDTLYTILLLAHDPVHMWVFKELDLLFQTQRHAWRSYWRLVGWKNKLICTSGCTPSCPKSTIGKYWTCRTMRMKILSRSSKIDRSTGKHSRDENWVDRICSHLVISTCFTFALARTTRNTHDVRISARAIHSLEIHFWQLTPRIYYLVDSGFSHWPRYMASYKGFDILYHFQIVYDGKSGRRHNFRNACKKFNFGHSCRNVIERAFGVWKSCWKILDCMPSYNFKVQTVVVIATMGVHNFFRQASMIDKAFTRAKMDLDATEMELSDIQDKIKADLHALKILQNEWDRLRDYLPQHQWNWLFMFQYFN